jgi:hypothetical protein
MSMAHLTKYQIMMVNLIKPYPFNMANLIKPWPLWVHFVQIFSLTFGKKVILVKYISQM